MPKPIQRNSGRASLTPEDIKRRMAQHLQDIQDLIRDHGWAVQTIMTNPAYSYTVGLSKKGFPEIVVMALPFETAEVVLNHVARELIAGKLVLEEGARYTEVFDSFDAKFRKLPSAVVSECLRVACTLAPDTTPPDAWQLLWPAPNGAFEGEPDMDDTFVAMQNLPLAHAGYGPSPLN